MVMNTLQTEAPTKDHAWAGLGSYTDVADGQLGLHMVPLVRRMGADSGMDSIVCFSITGEEDSISPGMTCYAGVGGQGELPFSKGLRKGDRENREGVWDWE